MSAAPLAVAIRRLPHGADLPLPSYATEGSAGLDVLAAIADEIVLAPGRTGDRESKEAARPGAAAAGAD